MLGKWLPSYRKRAKRKVSTSPKFYFSDVGVVSCLSKRGAVEMGSELMGKAFENWIFHEIDCHRMYSELYYNLSFWRLTSGIEVDFILGDMEVAIEVKSSQKVRPEYSKGLLQLKIEHPTLKRMLLVCTVDERRVLDSGVEVMPYQDFLNELWSGEIVK
jgi:predicted AAA+ superfamily ATPase